MKRYEVVSNNSIRFVIECYSMEFRVAVSSALDREDPEWSSAYIEFEAADGTISNGTIYRR